MKEDRLVPLSHQLATGFVHEPEIKFRISLLDVMIAHSNTNLYPIIEIGWVHVTKVSLTDQEPGGRDLRHIQVLNHHSLPRCTCPLDVTPVIGNSRSGGIPRDNDMLIHISFCHFGSSF